MRTYILGSRSPRRLELLKLLIPAEQIRVLPPDNPAEPDFADCSCWQQIEERLQLNVRQKWDDVQQQILQQPALSVEQPTIITADTVIVVQTPELQVLGQPPAENWQQTVGNWFRDYYAGQSHVAATAVCVGSSQHVSDFQICKSEVYFHDEIDSLLEWYLQTEEPIGKAGGYAVQGAGSMFIRQIRGSLSNIIGLPLEQLREMIMIEEQS